LFLNFGAKHYVYLSQCGAENAKCQVWLTAIFWSPYSAVV